MTDQTGSKPAVDKVCGYEYTVKRGDSFYLIAHRLGVPLRDLLEANSDVNPARLMVGDVLCIPMEEDDAPPADTPQAPPAADAAPPSSDSGATVPPANALPEEEPTPPIEQTPAQTGTPEADSAANITPAVCPEQNRYTVAANETIADIQLRTGLNLHTLALANPNEDLDDLEAGQVLCVPEENIPCPVATTVMLRQDDTLEAVALRYNVSMGALLRANPCLAPGDFMQGACITLPYDD